MSIVQQLRANGLGVFPVWVRWDAQKGRYEKGPSVPKGESWKHTALRDYSDPALDWSSGVYGVVIPDGVVVLDLDTYKGSTREQVEQWLGCSLNWDAAMIQRTVGGGEHYAFRCDFDVRQLQDDDLVGLDTRAPGRGFIASGEGYQWTGFGLLGMTAPHGLPAMPDAARERLERKQRETSTATQTDVDETDVIEALRHVSPACGRAEWVRVGLALRHFYVDDEAHGEYVFDQWSSGALTGIDTPENYVPEHIPHQWGSFSPKGDTTIATLFYMAMRNGWRPPATFDAAAAFGQNAADTSTFNALVERIRTDGCDIAQTQSIIDEVRTGGCNDLQVALLAAELKSELKEAGVKDKAVTSIVDRMLQPAEAPASRPAGPGEYGKFDADNAHTFLNKFYPNGRLIQADGEFYAYDGRIWSKISSAMVKHQVAADMVLNGAQVARINACIDLVMKLAPVHDGGMNEPLDGLIIFTNGVLNMATGELYPHDMRYMTTVMLPYDYDPTATSHQWQQFLFDVFEGDHERVALLQEWLGYLMSHDYRHHKVMMMLGPSRSGKGTIGRILRDLVGVENYAGGSLSSFADDAFIDGLRTKPVLFIGDAEKKVSGNDLPRVIERVKTISGNDTVNFKRKFLSSLSEALPTRITIAANSVPALFDDSGALAGRIMILPMYRSYLGREDLGLYDRLRASELPGIAVWALEGLRRLNAQGHFTQPAASAEEQAYLVENYSPLSRFIDEHCRADSREFIAAADLYEIYRAWAINEGEDPLRRKTFTGSIKDAMRAHGVRYGVFSGKRGFQGMTAEGQQAPLTAAFKRVK